MNAPSTTMDATVFHRAVEAAIRAPSMHNTQPWRFRVRDGGLDVLADPSRTLPVADPHGWALRIAGGAAIFNARLAFAVAGRPAQVRLRPDATLLRDARYRDELTAWSRTAAADDGVSLAAGGPSPEPQDLLAMRDFGGPTRAPGRDFESDPLVAVLSTAGDTVHDQLVAGQALQRILLTATVPGLASSMLSQPIEVPAARERLRGGLSRRGCPQMVLRIGFGQPGFPTPRRPVTKVLDA